MIAFASSASNLVAGDTNGGSDVFVRDLNAGTTTRVSVASDGTPGNGGSRRPALSAGGRFVAFVSGATNLVSPPTAPGCLHVYVHDRITGTTTLVDVALDGTEGNGTSSERPAISADGTVIAFASSASNLVISDTNGFQDVFVRNLTSGTTTRASVAGDGDQANGESGGGGVALSADGRVVVFSSGASNLVPGVPGGLYIRDLGNGTTTVVADGIYSALSADGRVARSSPSAVAFSRVEGSA